MSSLQAKKAFTLIELLVVIAIIALLLSIIIPSLNLAKRQASGAVCLANENQLSKTWFLYSQDNNGELVDGQPEPGAPFDGRYDYGTFGIGYNFVAPPLDRNYTTSNAAERFSLEGRIRGFERGALWQYIEAPKVYHCPGDMRSAKDEQRYGYRTYSIGAVYSRLALMKSISTHTWEGNVVVTKFSQISNPSSKFVWLEEMDVQSNYNNNTWNIFLGTTPRTWYDPVAVWHGDSSTFGFADGHAERHKWVNDLTKNRGNFDIQMQTGGSSQKIAAVDPGETDDWDWVVHRYIPGRIPSDLANVMPR